MKNINRVHRKAGTKVSPKQSVTSTVNLLAPRVGVNLELESAFKQAKALNALLEHHLLYAEDGNDYSDDIKCGIVELSSTTFARLELACNCVQRKAGAQ